MAPRIALAAWFALGAVACNDEGAKRNVDPFCATRPQLELCEDFDELPLPGYFDQKIVEEGTLVVENDALSTPRALNAQIASSTGIAKALLRRTFGWGPKLRVLAQVRLDKVGTGSAELLALDFPEFHLAVIGKADGTIEGLVRDAAGDVRTPATITLGLPIGEWTSLRINSNLDGAGGGTMTIFIGEDAVVGPLDIHPPTGEIPATLEAGFKAETPGQSGWQMRYDNITFTRF